MKKLIKLTVVAACLLGSHAFAQKVTVSMSQAAKEKSTHSVGTVSLQDTPHGLLIHPDLHGLSPGIHGMHVHEVGSCENFAQAALGHYDPKKTDRHRGPFDNTGHLGDLPVLIVEKSKKATLPLYAPRLKVSDIQGHALVIHSGGDNYSDKPQANGGGGDRIACGIVPKGAAGTTTVKAVSAKPAPAKVSTAPVVAPGPAAELAPVVESGSAAELTPVVESGPAAELAPVVESGPAAELAPVVESGPAADVIAAPPVPAVKPTPVAPIQGSAPAANTKPSIDSQFGPQ